jgi:predicted component of type VI protein secretion system
LRVIDGSDRGRVFDDLVTPVSIGREEGNTIQLNDERISRFHAKIQEDQDKLILTDLESTNGTKVNGEDVQLRILRYGDVISLGRSVLVYGSREQIAGRLHTLRRAQPADGPEPPSLDAELSWSQDPDAQKTLHTLLPPELPQRLGAGQTAQFAELLEYLRARLRDLISSVEPGESEGDVTIALRDWQNIVDLQSLLARYVRQIGEPETDDGLDDDP